MANNIIPAICIFYQGVSVQTTLPALFCEEIFEVGRNRHPVVIYHKDRDWYVEIDFIDGNFVFRNGWNQFVVDNRLVFGDVLVFKPINEHEWSFVYVRDQPVHDDMVIDAKLHYPTLTYLPLRDDQVRSYFGLQRGQYDHIVVEAVDGFKWNLFIQYVKATSPMFGFTGQWVEMARNYKLAVDDYLVFQRLTGTWTFRMYVFDYHGIERVNFTDDFVYNGPDLHPELGYVPMVIEIENDDEAQPQDMDEGGPLAIEDDVGMVDLEEPVLDIIVPQLQAHNILEVIVRDRLRLPVQFARDNNLDAEVDLVLINPNGVDVETGIAIERNGLNRKYRVRHWADFVRLNGLEQGTLVVFEYNDATHSLILTDVLG